MTGSINLVIATLRVSQQYNMFIFIAGKQALIGQGLRKSIISN